MKKITGNVKGFIKDPVKTIKEESQRALDNVGDMVLGAIAAPVLDAIKLYRAYLRKQGGLKPLPDKLISILERSNHYSNVNLRAVRYAENIKTESGCHVTFENEIFFCGEVDFSSAIDLHVMLHELEHVSQYMAHGGFNAFISKYIIQIIAVVGSNPSSINMLAIHDKLGLEKDAENKAQNIIKQVYSDMKNPVTKLKP